MMFARTSAVAALLFHTGCGASDLERATANSRAHGDRPLVIMATAEWCGPCQDFKKNVLPSPQVQGSLREVQFVMLDDATSKGSIRQLGVRGYPTFVVVRPDRKVVAALNGRPSAARFVDFLQWGTPNWFIAESLEEQLAANPSARTRIYAARWSALNGDLPRAGALYRQALAGLTAGEEYRRPELRFEMMMVGSVGTDALTFAAAAAAYVAEFPGSHHVRAATELALAAGGLGQAEARALALGVVARARDLPQTLNDLVYTLLAVGQPDAALAAARRQVELTPDNPNAFDTLAEAHNYLGQRDQALAAAARAIAMEKASDSRAAYQTNRKRFAAGKASGEVDEQRARVRATLRRYRIGAAATDTPGAQPPAN